MSAVSDGPRDAGTGARSGSAASGGPAGTLDGIGTADLSSLRIGATLVAGPWKELGIGGLLWDGSHLVAIDSASAPLVSGVIRERRLPVSVDLGGLRARGTERTAGVPLVALGREAGHIMPSGTPPSPPRTRLDGLSPAWVSLVGTLDGPASSRELVLGVRRVPLEERCGTRTRQRGVVRVTAIALGDPVRLLVPCDGIIRAPSLAVSRATAPGAAAPTPTPVPATAVVDGDRRPLAGILILLAAGLLGGAVVAGRVRSGFTLDGPVVDGAVEQAEHPRLTLLRVPREHGL